MKADLGSLTNEIKEELESVANQVDSLKHKVKAAA
jgi:hypothetical protein